MGKNGRDERIRTSDPSVPNAMLYQTEPRPDRKQKKTRRNGWLFLRVNTNNIY